MMDANKLNDRWRNLAERFRRIADNDCSDSDIKAAAAIAGQLLPETRLQLTDLIFVEPSAEELQNHSRQPDVIVHLWSTCWIGFVIGLRFNPAVSVANPLSLSSNHVGGPDDLVVGRTHNEGWRVRAENFAEICDRLADSLSVAEPPAADCFVTLLQIGAIVSRGKRTARRLYDQGKLPPPAVEGKRGKPHEWRWSEVRPILESECGRPLPEVFPADRFIRS